MDERLKKIEDSLYELSTAVKSAFEKINANLASFDKRFDNINSKLTTLSDKIDLLQGNSTHTIETLETGFKDIQNEIGKIAIVTRYEHDLPYIKKESDTKTPN